MRKYSKELHEQEKDLYVGHWMDAKKSIKYGTAKVLFWPESILSKA